MSRRDGPRLWSGGEAARDPYPRADADVDRAIVEDGYSAWIGTCPHCGGSIRDNDRPFVRRTLKSHIRTCSSNPDRPPPPASAMKTPLKDLVRVEELASDLGMSEAHLRAQLSSAGAGLRPFQRHLTIREATAIRELLSRP